MQGFGAAAGVTHRTIMPASGAASEGRIAGHISLT